MTFQLDTSGHVQVSHGPPELCQHRELQWSDLTPFTQGYIEALFAAHSIELYRADTGQTFSHGAFDMLAPETLARIIEDCADVRSRWPGGNRVHTDGVRFWLLRQDPAQILKGRSQFTRLYPPLTVTLRDDGKVAFE